MFAVVDTNSKAMRNGPSRKRTRHDKQSGKAEEDCSFCAQVLAAVLVEMPASRKKRVPTPYCLACYYTTSAVRQDPTKYVSVCNQVQLDEQLPTTQQLFSEIYVELHKELQEESNRSFRKQQSDPLALLHGGGVARRRMTHRTAVPKIGTVKTKAGGSGDGGFLRGVPLPERLMKTQRDQARLQAAQIARMNAIASGGVSAESGLFKRRKASRKSIWNMAMDPNQESAEQDTPGDISLQAAIVPACSCGSKDVQPFGNITSRNQDLKKGETWGAKDRGNDVVFRYRCNSCGKMWNEEE